MLGAPRHTKKGVQQTGDGPHWSLHGQWQEIHSMINILEARERTALAPPLFSSVKARSQYGEGWWSAGIHKNKKERLVLNIIAHDLADGWCLQVLVQNIDSEVGSAHKISSNWIMTSSNEAQVQLVTRLDLVSGDSCEAMVTLRGDTWFHSASTAFSAWTWGRVAKQEPARHGHVQPLPNKMTSFKRKTGPPTTYIHYITV